MSFKQTAIAGMNLVREAIRSPNYLMGLSGWTINRDGTAEFNNVTVRGTIVVGGPPPEQAVVISTSSGIARIELYSSDPQEVSPAFISNRENGGLSFFEIDTSDDGFGVNQLIAVPPQSNTDSTSGYAFLSTAVAGSIVELDTDVRLRVDSAGNISTNTSDDHGIQVGLPSTFHIAIGDVQIQARNNGAVNNLILNELGGNIVVGAIGFGTGDGTLILANDNSVALASTDNALMTGAISGLNMSVDREIIQVRNNGAVSTLALQHFGGNLVVFAGAAASTYTLAVNGFVTPGDAHADVSSVDGTQRDTTSTSYVAVSTTVRFDFPAPTSGKAFFFWHGLLDNSVAGETCSVSFRVTNTAESIEWFSPSDNYRSRSVGTTGDFRSSFMLATGLPQTGTLRAQLMFKSSDIGNTASTDQSSIGYYPVL